jgi:hypothetical protein
LFPLGEGRCEEESREGREMERKRHWNVKKRIAMKKNRKNGRKKNEIKKGTYLIKLFRVMTAK